MLRAALIAAISLAALAPVSSALADDHVCMSVPELATALAQQSIDVGPFFSSDGAMLISRSSLDDLLLRAELESKEGTPLSEILWCWSGNDPRCSPTTPAHDDGPHVGRTAPCAFVDEAGTWPKLAEGLAHTLREEDRGARDGVRSRVERPPRA